MRCTNNAHNMKKAIFVALFVALATPSLTFAAFDTDLRYGSQGSKVFELQEFLTAQGVYAGPITGNFFSLTLAGVKAFQTAHSVQPVSGFFGPITRGVAGSILSQDLAESDAEASTTPVVVEQPRTFTPRTQRHMEPGTSSPTPAPSGSAQAPAAPATIEVITTDSSQELGDTFAVSDGNVSLENTVFLGAIVRDSNGNNVRDAAMTVSVDGEEVKQMNGTGNTNGSSGIFFYPFSYTFQAAGEHTFTFSALGADQQVRLTAE